MRGSEGTRTAWGLLAICASLIAVLAALFDGAGLGAGAKKQLWALNQTQYQEFRDKVKARKMPALDGRFGADPDARLAPEVATSHGTGDYAGPISVTLQAPTGFESDLRFTTDGSVPTRDSERYGGPIRIDSTTVLRWRLLPRGELPGIPQTAVYLIGSDRQLPALALTLDPVNLWNKYSGLYEHPEARGRAFERPAQLSWIPRSGTPVEFEANIRIHGGYSRLGRKKSFRLRFPTASATGLRPDDLLSRNGSGGETETILRAGGTAQVFRVRDALSSALYAELGRPTSALQPVQVYLNGAYWGLYDLRERIGEGYLEAHFGRGPYELLGFDSENPNRWMTASAGNRQHWERTIAFFRDADLSQAAQYDSAGKLLDLDDIADYWIHNIYAANADWPYNNVYVYRALSGDGRWRFIHWDADGTFDPTGRTRDHATLDWSLRDRVRNDLKWNAAALEDRETYLVSTLLMRRLLRSPGFRAKFILRAQILLDSHYNEDHVQAVLAPILAGAQSERTRDFARWEYTDSAHAVSMQRLQDFIRTRPAGVREQFKRYFQLGSERTLRLTVTGPGSLRFGGVVFRDTTIALPLFVGTELDWGVEPDAGARLATDPTGLPVAVVDTATRLNVIARFLPERHD